MLNLTGFTVPPPGQSKLGDRALVVNCGDMVRMYGRWDVLFGSWECPSGRRRWREVLLQKPILSPTGFWMSNVLFGANNPGGASPPDHLSHQFHEAYLSLIPVHIRRLAAPFGEHQWLAMDLMWMVPELCVQIDDVMTNVEFGLIGAELGLSALFEASRDERLRHAVGLLKMIHRRLEAPT